MNVCRRDHMSVINCPVIVCCLHLLSKPQSDSTIDSECFTSARAGAKNFPVCLKLLFLGATCRVLGKIRRISFGTFAVKWY